MKKEELLQSAKPILFNTEIVRAILDGRKTMTRRVIKANKVNAVLNSPARKSNPDIPDEKFIRCLVNQPYEVGDILYVRETWCKTDCFGTCNGYVYRAEKEAALKILEETTGFVPKWHPSIHMPKEAARIILKVTDVCVERLQEITVEQICREGVETEYPYNLNGEEKICAFSQLWDSTIKKADIDAYGWDANPWVWVIEFERTGEKI